MRLTGLALFCALAAACGSIDPNEGSDAGVRTDGTAAQTDAAPPPPPPNAHVRGTVFAPNGRAFSPPLTIMNALVYVTDNVPAPIPPGVYCERCTALPADARYTKTDEFGMFDLNIWDGAYILVIQKGQFRLVRPIVVGAGATLEVSPEDTTLPSRNSSDGNDTIPKIALLSGSYDKLEGLFAKIGLADMSGDTVQWSDNTQFDVYSNGGSMPPAGSARNKGTALSLLSSLEKMKQYHMIFVPCSSEADSIVSNATVKQNVKDYVKLGGKYYVADWSYDYLRQVYRTRDDGPIVHFAGSGDGDTLGSANAVSSSFDSQGHAVDQDLFKWLNAQQQGWGGDSLVLKENWDWIMSLEEGYVGDDPENGPQYRKADVIVEGPHDGNSSWKSLPPSEIYPLTIGFQSGCGRVLYTTYHTVGEMGAGHTGLEVQERILIYLIMEIGVCQAGPILE
ncbi:MAG TPA: hypothetical protein VGQ83_05090 [Polyangia bacterium]|jgi:hypothetical protein